MEGKNQVETARDLALAAAGVKRDTLHDGSVLDSVIVPEGATLLDLQQYMGAPRRTKAVQLVRSLDSFVAYLEHYHTVYTVVFGHPGQLEAFTAIIDYHTPDSPNWGDHQVRLKTETTPQWEKWTKAEKSRMDQRTFARFLEDNAMDILNDLAPVVQAVKEVKASRGGHVRSQVSDDGQESDSSATLKVTSQIAENLDLSLSIWRFSEPYKIRARVFTHLDDGKVSFSYQLVNADRAKDALFDDYLDTIREKTGLTVYV